MSGSDEEPQGRFLTAEELMGLGEGLMTVAEGARVLRVDVKVIHEAIARGDIKVAFPGLIDVAALVALRTRLTA